MYFFFQTSAAKTFLAYLPSLVDINNSNWSSMANCSDQFFKKNHTSDYTNKHKFLTTVKLIKLYKSYIITLKRIINTYFTNFSSYYSIYDDSRHFKQSILNIIRATLLSLDVKQIWMCENKYRRHSVYKQSPSYKQILFLSLLSLFFCCFFFESEEFITVCI